MPTSKQIRNLNALTTHSLDDYLIVQKSGTPFDTHGIFSENLFTQAMFNGIGTLSSNASYNPAHQLRITNESSAPTEYFDIQLTNTGTVVLQTTNDSSSVSGFVFQSAASAGNSTNFFRVTQNDGTAILEVDAANRRVGINKAAPTVALDVAGIGLFTHSAGVGIQITNTGSGDSLNINAGTANDFVVDAAGNVGIGIDPGEALSVLDTASPQVRISYDVAGYATLGVVDGGDLTIATYQTNAGISLTTASGGSVVITSTGGGDTTLNSGDNTTITAVDDVSISAGNVLTIDATGVDGNGTLNLNADHHMTLTTDVDNYDINLVPAGSVIIDVDNSGSNETGVHITADGIGGSVGKGLHVTTTSSNTSAWRLVELESTSAAADNADLLFLQHYGNVGDSSTDHEGNMIQAVNGDTDVVFRVTARGMIYTDAGINVAESGDNHARAANGTIKYDSTLGSPDFVGYKSGAWTSLTGTVAGVAADDISAGDAAVNISTSSGDITLTPTGNVFAVSEYLALNDGATGPGELRIYADSDDTGTFYSALTVGVLTETVTYRLPLADGDADDVLSTDSNGNLSWVENTGGGSYTHPHHSGDVVSVNDGATTIQADVVTYAKMQNMSANRILGRGDVGAGDVTEITPGALRTLINVEDGSTGDPPDATLTVKGIVELATTGETTTGSDATRAVTPAGAKAALDLKANLASPTFTGTIAIPNIADLETAVAANTLKATNVSTALSAGTVNATTYGITSDGGANDIVLPEADTDNAGLLGAAKWDEIVANTAKAGNVSTALSTGTVSATSYGITSDGGTDDVVLAQADTNNAGLLSAAKWDEIVANNAKVTNVSTNLSATANGTSLTVESSDGTNVALPAATTSAWGVMSDDQATKLDGIATSANNYTLPAASVTVVGGVELATNAETTTGTDTARAVTPAGAKAALDLKANLAGPTFTGVVTSPDLTLTDIENAGEDTDQFLVLDSGGRVDFRTGVQVLSDIGAASGGSGSMTTVKRDNSQVGDSDIVTLDFSTDFGVAETPDTEVQITINTLNQDTSGNAATVTNGVYTTSKLSVMAATTSAELKTVISDETGTGALVFATSPTLVTPALGTPSALVGTNISGTAANLTVGAVNSSIQNAVELSPHGTSAGNTGEIRFLELAANGTNYVGFKAPDATAGQIYVLPAADGSDGQQLTTDGDGTLSWAAAATASGTPTAITVADTTDTTSFVALFESATGDLGPKTDAGITYDAGTGMLTATGLTGPLTGNATTVTNGVYTTNNLSVMAATTSAQLAGVISDETGSGALVFATSPTLVTPALGTPSALVGTNITGTAANLTAGAVTTNANLTGHVTSVGNAASLGTFTVAQLSTALSDANISGNNTGDQTTISGNAATATTAATALNVRVTDEEDDDNSYALTFVLDLDGNTSIGLKSDGTLFYNPSTGTLSATTFAGALTGNASTVTTNANLTGHVTSSGNAASLGSFTVAQLSTALSDANISGNNTGDQTSVSGNAGTVTNGVYTTSKISVLAATTSAELKTVISDETGSGALVFATSPTLVTPALGTPASGNLASCTFPTLNQNTTGSSATCTGNAATATILATARDISGASFNGSASITIEGTGIGSTTNGNEAATKFLRADGDGTCSWQTPSVSVSVTDDSDDAVNTVVFHDESGGTLHDDTGAFTYNPSTGIMSVPKLNVTGEYIYSDDGGEFLHLDAPGSPVNYFQFKSSATGNALELNAKGDDANIDLELNRKGSGSILLGTKVKVRTNNITTSSGALNIDATTVYFNNNAINRDLRANGEGKNDLLWVDASALTVKMGGDLTVGISAGSVLEHTLYVDQSEKRVGIAAGDSPDFGFDCQTGMGYKVATKTADYTMGDTDRVIYGDATSGSVTITLPAAVLGRVVEVYRKDMGGMNTVSVARAGSDSINGGTSALTLSTQYEGYRLICVEAAVWVAHYQTVTPGA